MCVYRTSICLLVFLYTFNTGFAQKTDKVYLKNGDVLTGEIKGLSLALLSFDLDGPGTIDIKWEKVNGLRSGRIFEIQLSWGEIIVGRIDSAFLQSQHAGFDDIVEITPIKDKFIRRLSGSVNLGFNYTKSSNILQSNLSSGVTYRIPKMELGIKLNSVISNSSSDSTLTKKQDLILNALKYFSGQYFAFSQLGWQQNSELGLSNRFFINGAVGKNLLINNHNRMIAGGGFSLNTEQSIENSSYVGNVDALAFIQYKRFYYSSPKLSLNAYLILYPGLTEWGRIRTEFDFKVNIEVVRDFSIGLTFYDNYDNRPPEGALSKNDFGISFTIGYTFGK